MLDYVVGDYVLYQNLADAFWETRKETLNRSVGKLFKEIFRRLKESGNFYSPTLPKIALLALAANHDIPSIKRLHPRTPNLIYGALPSSNKNVFAELLGRRHLERLLDHVDTINTFLEKLKKIKRHSTLEKIVPKITQRELQLISKREKRNVPWVDLLIRKMFKWFESVDNLTELVNKYSSGLHPDDAQAVAFFLASHLHNIHKDLLSSQGESFYDKKFGEQRRFVEEVEEGLKVLNKEGKYKLAVPKNVVEHIAAQVRPESCTSWPQYFSEILHGPSIPVVIKDGRTKKIIGRIFFTLAQDENGKYYVVMGNYEGKKKGKKAADKVIKIVKEVARRLYGTELLPYTSIRHNQLRLRAPHEQPWI